MENERSGARFFGGDMRRHVEETQTTNAILMVSPDQFGFNTQTAESNTFQNRPTSETNVRDKALAEFQQMVAQLENEGIKVYVVSSPEGKLTPDAVFPNNWVSFHNNQIVLYPMLAPNRRAERQLPQVQEVLRQGNRSVNQEITNLTGLENEGHYLEGTGSLVLDRVNKVAFANLSARTHMQALPDFAKATGYKPVTFRSFNVEKQEVYHTNVVMSIGDGYAVVCLDSIPDPSERAKVIRELKSSDHEIIPICLEQMHNFCGNILQVRSLENKPKIVMSTTALNAFTPEQRATLEKYGKLVAVDIPTIESVGGGSARCMMAEVFPPEEVR